MSTTILNFAHPLTEAQTGQVAVLLGTPVETITIPTQVDRQQPLIEEVYRLVDSVGWNAEAWQTRSIVLNPPALAPVALALIAELHGRCGYFLPIIHIRPVEGALPPRYEVAEIVNLNAVREQARTRRHM